MKRTFVCASSCIKQYVQPSYGCRWTPVVAPMCVDTVRKNYLIHKMLLQNSTGTRKKIFFLKGGLHGENENLDNDILLKFEHIKHSFRV